MNTLIAKQAVLYSLIFGAVLALFGSFNFLIGLVAFILALLCAPAVILFMKKTNKIGFLESQQAATLGGLCGFCATISFFLIFKTDIDFVTNQLLPNNELEINDNWQVSLQNEELGTAYIMNGELYLHVTNHGKSKLQLIDENGYVYNYYIIIKEDETIKMQATD